MPRWLPRVLRWGALVCLLSAPAHAQEADAVTRDAARSLGLSGVDAYQAGQYDVASSRLEKAYALLNVPSLGLWSARALAKRNLLVEAASRYFEVVGLQLPQGDAAVQRQAQTDAQLEVEQLRPRIPRLIIQVSGAEAAEVTLVIDGQAVPSSVIGKPRLVNPGAHHVEGKLAALQKTATVEVALAQEAAVELDFSPAPKRALPSAVTSEPTSTRRTLGWVGVGAGGVGLALGSVMGALALREYSAIKDSGDCPNNICPAEKRANLDRFDNFGTAATVSLVAGGLLASLGVVLVLTAPSNEPELAATFAGDRVTLSGHF